MPDQQGLKTSPTWSQAVKSIRHLQHRIRGHEICKGFPQLLLQWAGLSCDSGKRYWSCMIYCSSFTPHRHKRDCNLIHRTPELLPPGERLQRSAARPLPTRLLPDMCRDALWNACFLPYWCNQSASSYLTNQKRWRQNWTLKVLQKSAKSAFWSQTCPAHHGRSKCWTKPWYYQWHTLGLHPWAFPAHFSNVQCAQQPSNPSFWASKFSLASDRCPRASRDLCTTSWRPRSLETLTAGTLQSILNMSPTQNEKIFPRIRMHQKLPPPSGSPLLVTFARPRAKPIRSPQNYHQPYLGRSP